MPTTVEFIGGPIDGDVRVIHDLIPEFRIPEMAPPKPGYVYVDGIPSMVKRYYVYILLYDSVYEKYIYMYDRVEKVT